MATAHTDAKDVNAFLNGSRMMDARLPQPERVCREAASLPGIALCQLFLQTERSFAELFVAQSLLNCIVGLQLVSNI